MAHTAWPTTADLDEVFAGAGITPRPALTTARKQAMLDAVVAEVGLSTRRQFIPGSAGEVRRFDGSGTPELDVDEFISITMVRALFGWTTVAGWNLTAMIVPLPESGLPNTRIGIFYTTWPILGNFPAGRGNIEVTATWGYGAAIPDDLWEAVAIEAARRLGSEQVTNFGYSSLTGTHTGAVKSWSGAQVSQTFEMPWKMLNDLWPHSIYLSAIRRYRRPGARMNRHLRPAMI